MMRETLKAIRLLLTLRCKHSSQLISEGMDDEWSDVERWAVRLHYISCNSCRRLRQQVDFIRRAAGSLDETFIGKPGFQLTASARNRLAGEIRRAIEEST